MVRQLWLYVLIICSAMSVLIAVSYRWTEAATEAEESPDLIERLTSADAWIGLLQRHLLFDLGISTDADHVIVGRDGWLFLGDAFRGTRTRGRNACQPGPRADVARSAARVAWHDRFAAAGAGGTYFALWPDKGTVYPDRLPAWARPPSCSSEGIDGEPAQPGSLILTGSRVRAAAEATDELLYYPTDTHWNALGALEGYFALFESIAQLEPELEVLDRAGIGEIVRAPGRAGDLPKFLFLDGLVFDEEIGLPVQPHVDVTVRDYPDGDIKALPYNSFIGIESHPVLVESKGALNDERVLWLHDSFGVHLSPYMAATFSTVLRQSWMSGFDDPSTLLELVERFEPDLVLVTVIERDFFDERLVLSPPD